MNNLITCSSILKGYPIVGLAPETCIDIEKSMSVKDYYFDYYFKDMIIPRELILNCHMSKNPSILNAGNKIGGDLP